MIERTALKADFRSRYRREPRVFSAPGRVNLIGEHTDYNAGFVLPMAIEARTYVAAASRPDRLLRVHSLDMGESHDLDLDAPGVKHRGSWLDYVEGTARCLEQRGIPLEGADLLIGSNVPFGAGLSSSAALELAVGLALASLAAGDMAEIPRLELALAGQQAEHEYVGTQCGLMDQFIVAFGARGQALLLDCRSLEARAITLRLDAAKLLICDSGVKHELAGSAYNQRRAECQEGVRLLQSVAPHVHALRDATLADLARASERLPENVRKRCRHVITENERTVAAADAFEAGDLSRAGRFMFESHESLRRDYEVSSPELDFLVETARESGLVFGARMTGGGFGGCTINLVQHAACEAVSEQLSRAYRERFGRAPRLFVSEPSDGAREEPTFTSS